MLIVTRAGAAMPCCARGAAHRGEPAAQRPHRGRIAGPGGAPARLVVGHGNGPQVGLLALQGAAYGEVETYPLDVLGAQTEGMIGYMIEQELGNLLPFERPFRAC